KVSSDATTPLQITAGRITVMANPPSVFEARENGRSLRGPTYGPATPARTGASLVGFGAALVMPRRSAHRRPVLRRRAIIGERGIKVPWGDDRFGLRGSPGLARPIALVGDRRTRLGAY